MSLDKFGRFSKDGAKGGERGPSGIGFVLSPSGDYDIKNKRIINLREPMEEKDAVTKSYFDAEFKKTISILDYLKIEINKCKHYIENVENKLNKFDVKRSKDS